MQVIEASRVRPVGVGPHPRGATVGDYHRMYRRLPQTAIRWPKVLKGADDRRSPSSLKVGGGTRRSPEEAEGPKSPKVPPKVRSLGDPPEVGEGSRRSGASPKVTGNLRDSVPCMNRIEEIICIFQPVKRPSDRNICRIFWAGEDIEVIM